MRSLLPAMALCLGALAAARAAEPPASEQGLIRYSPPSRMFACEIPAAWGSFEQTTPTGRSVHVVGPALKGGTWRAAYHVHYREKGKAGFVSMRQAIKNARHKDATSERESTSATTRRVGKKLAQVFEVREKRMLPTDLLPAALTDLHHFYAVVGAGGEDYIVIKLSVTEAVYLDYRPEFLRFLGSFTVIGY